VTTGIRLLHVEDNRSFAELTAEVLETRTDDFEVVTVNSPAEATDRLNERQFDCVVSDYDMPGRNGIEFLKEIREESPELPFVLFTGKGSESIASEAMSKGATDYLQKGGGTEQYELLANRVRNAVEQYRAVRRADEYERISSVVREIDSALVQANSTDEIERQVCKILTDADPYTAACIAGVDADAMCVDPRSWAGEGADYFTELDMYIGPDSPGRDAPVGRAFHDRTVAVSQNILDDAKSERWRDAATDRGFRSLAVVPLDYGDMFHGLLALFSDRRSAFNDTEQQLLSDLGEDIAHALHAHETQSELRATAARFDAMFEDPNILVGLLDTDGTVLDVNETALGYVDAAASAVTGREFWATPWWSDELRSEVREEVERAASGEYVTYDADLTEPDGTPYCVSGVIRPVRDEDGSIASLIVSARDVTERVEQRRELERTRDQIGFALRNTDTVVWQRNVEAGTVRTHPEPNPVLDAEADTREAFFEQVHPADRGELRESIREARQSGNSYVTEFRLEGSETRWVEEWGQPVEWNGEREMVGVTRDITERKRTKRELEATRTRFRALTENTDMIILTIDDTSTIQYVNDAVERVLGYEPAELVGESLPAIIPDRFREDHDAGIARYLETGQKQLDWGWIEFPGLHRDGHEVPLGVSFGEATVDGDHRFTAVLRDITERREYERSLEQTQRRFEAIIDSPDSLIGILRPDGTLERANQTAVDLVDATREELEGQAFWRTPWWDHSEELQDRLHEWVRQAAAGDYVQFEATHPTADGDDIPVDGVLRPVTDSDGEVVSIVAEARDVSDRTERERELARQRNRLEQLNRINETLRSVHRELVGADDRDGLETAVCESLAEADVYDGVWIGRYNPDVGRIRPTTWVNIDEDHMRTLDVNVNDAPEGEGPAASAVRSQTVKTVRDVTSAEQMLPWRDQLTSLNVESVAAIPIVHGDTVRGIVGIHANRPDVFGDNEQAALAELGQAIGNAFESIETQNALERQNERLDEFAGIVSHDLRNPLNVARGHLDLVREERDSEHLEAVARAHDRMGTLIDDLLTLSRDGKAVDDVEPVNLERLAADCWAAVATTDASIVVATEQTVCADRSRFRQLLENLFRNAVEHGGTDVTITIGEIENGFYISDDGPGIPPDERDNVLESGYSTTPDGTGFGLAIVKEIARAHGWDIHLSESKDGGARFDMTGVEMIGGE